MLIVTATNISNLAEVSDYAVFGRCLNFRLAKFSRGKDRWVGPLAAPFPGLA